jgi:hypothetical protein
VSGCTCVGVGERERERDREIERKKERDRERERERERESRIESYRESKAADATNPLNKDEGPLFLFVLLRFWRCQK